MSDDQHPWPYIQVPIPKGLLLLTRAEYTAALKRGKAYKRWLAREQRAAHASARQEEKEAPAC